MKKSICIMLTALLLLNIPLQNVYAADSVAVEQESGSKSEEVNDGEKINTGETTDDIQEANKTQKKEEAIEENTQKNVEQNIDNSEQVAIKDEEKLQTQEDNMELLNYVVVDKTYVQAGDVQSILVSVGTGKQNIKSATLQYHREEDEKSYQVDASKIEQDAVLFEVSYEKNAETGIYVLDSLTYTIGTNEYTIEIKQTGIEAKYGVNKTVTTESDAKVVDSNDEKLSVEEEVVSFDKEGNQVSENSIEEAISGVADEPQIATYSGETNAGSGARNKEVIVVLDPGHGGSDPGTEGNGLVEKNLTLSIAKYCKQELEQYSGVKIYMTREEDTYPSLTQRVELAKQWGANVLVSIHINSADATAAHGAEVWYPNSNYNNNIHNEGKELASQIQAQLVSLGLYNRGVKVLNASSTKYPDGSAADYYSIIRNSKLNGFPGIIVEHAFVSNSLDSSNYLNSEAKLKKLGVADATGIAKYFGLSKGSSTPKTYWETGKNGEKYYYENGKKVTGEKNISGKWYYFDPNKSGAMKIGFCNLGSKTVYYGSDGAMRYGEQKISGKWYYFDTWSGAMKTGFCNLGSKTVYYGSDGIMRYGEQKISGKWYYFDTVTGAMKTGFCNLGSKTVYYGTDGAMLYGVQKINGLTYYFDTVTGAMKTGLIKDTNGKEIYIEKTGKQVLGEKKIGSKWYYFDSANKGYMVKNDFITLNDGRKVYYGADGAMRYGEQRIAGKWYYFNTASGAMRTGFCNLGNKTVYYGTDGTMCYGEQRIAGKWYYFNMASGAMRTGFCNLENKTVYYGTDGAMRYGEQKISGKWYYFDTASGAMRIGFCNLGSKTVYYGTDGTMRYGEQKISGKWYYFDTASGAMRTGFCNLGSKTVYYGTDGTMCYGEKKIDGKNYYFDTVTGAMLRNAWMNGKYYQADGTQKSDETQQNYYLIEGTSTTNVKQMVQFYKKKCGANGYPAEDLKKGGAATIEEFAQIFYEEAEREGIRVEVAWTQTMIETGFLKFGGQVNISQFNFSGLGATDGGATGASFDDVRQGVRAQIQHLKAYANAQITTDKLATPCVDPRFKYVTKGCAKYVEWLGQKENPNGQGWATSKEYGTNIRKMIDELLKA